MARIFNIYFDYEGTTYSGMVTVRKTPFFIEYQLDFDVELMELLPGNKIISTGPDKFIFQHASGMDYHPVARTIINAVAAYHLPSEA